ncbi:phasin family protein [Paraburkholderia sp. EG304]|uniref:phasin family protein n=1 Tax=Paraburkholderia sp. EG304 TaxID=3237015 RepID=UPI00397A9FD8
MPFTLSVPSQLPDSFSPGFCALIRLNMDTCRSAVTGAALHWESVLRAQTPEQLVRRHVGVMPWLALQFAGYTRGWMYIASETIRPCHASGDPDDGHELQEETMTADVSACAAGVDAMTPGAMSPQVQPDGESVAEPHVREMVRDILERVAKPTLDPSERRSPPRARRSSSR